jgi:NhaP-type Na+/H+ or K+/H+ antiporter
MALGLAELILFGLLFDWLARRLKLPGLLGVLFVGMILGPYFFDFITPEIKVISYDLRMIALVVILLRAGFELSRKALAKVGGRAVLMSFIPCICEIFVITLVAPKILNLSYIESAILGTVLAAVSPAVVVPLMINFIEKKKGAKKGIPTLVLAGASCDDAVAIVLCTSFISMYVGKKVSLLTNILDVPVSVITGVIIGLISGYFLMKFFKRTNPRATKRSLIILGLSIILLSFQKNITQIFPFAALISIMSIGFIILEKDEHMAHEISSKLGKIWIFAQLLLFVLVGAEVNVPVAINAGLRGVLVIFAGLIGRSLGVQVCLFKSNLNIKEKIFVTFSYLPKATVQAAIGGAPLAAMSAAKMNIYPGEIILAIAVLSILVTAPLGAVLIKWSGEKFLKVSDELDKNSALEAALESK